MDHAKYAKKFADKWGTEYELLSQYEGSTEKVSVRHTRCGQIIEKNASEALRYGCVHCSRKENILKTRDSRKSQAELREDFNRRLHDKFGSKYTLIGEYVDAKTATRLRCECGREFNVRPDDLLYNSRGCNCAYWKKRAEKKQRRPKPKPEPLWTHEKYVRRVKEIWGDEFEVVSQFAGISKKIAVTHKTCGQTYEKSADSLIRGHGCLACSRSGESGGTMVIKKVLDDMKVNYSREVKLPGCMYINQLLYDFAVYDRSGDIVLLIECDGEHHFRAKQRTGGIEKLQRVQRRDEAKNEYCKRHALPLLRLKYTIVRGNKAYDKVRERIQSCLSGKV
ncbi:MAG: hypothetical protein E6Z15_07335 [Paenibacillus macerans]|nr:hypothetical protein [Paenibacillus macerans]